MTDIEQVRCDKCGIIRNKENGLMSKISPRGWEFVESSDLCPSCFQIFKKIFKEFLNEYQYKYE